MYQSQLVAEVKPQKSATCAVIYTDTIDALIFRVDIIVMPTK
jgi:hypothetical protein